MWQGKFSNGQASYRKTDAYKAFLASLPVTRDEIIRAVPIKSEFLWINSVIYDFLKLYRKAGHAPQIDWPSYYAFCLILMVIARKAGGNLADERDAILNQLRTSNLTFVCSVANNTISRLIQLFGGSVLRKLF